MRRRAQLAIWPLAIALGVGACGTEDEQASAPEQRGAGAGEEPEAASGGQRGFAVELEPVNDSGVVGRGQISQLGDTLRVQLEADGLVQRKRHPVRLHALEEGEPSSCPTAAADADGDGSVSFEEALAIYGPVAADLEPFARARGYGALSLQTTLVPPEGEQGAAAELDPLEDRVLVVYGLDASGRYDASIPVACATIEPIG